MADDADRAQEYMERLEDMRQRQMATRAGRRGNGVCCDCGERIDARRLRALPSAIRCLPCQGRLERVG